MDVYHRMLSKHRAICKTYRSYICTIQLLAKYKQHSQYTFSFSDNVNGWSAAASGTFAARCPAICAVPSQVTQLAFPAGTEPAASGFGDQRSTN